MQSLLKTVSFGKVWIFAYKNCLLVNSKLDFDVHKVIHYFYLLQKLQLPSSKVRSIGFLGFGGNSKKNVQKTEEQQTQEEKRVKSKFDESLTVSLNRLTAKSYVFCSSVV
jgi:hypothetical protein